MQRKSTRSIRKLIYQLKKRNGFKVTLCRPQNTSFDFETGVETNVTSFKVIKKAVLLPAEYLDSKGNIKYRYGSRYILIDWQDIKIIGIEANDIILFDDMSWRIIKVEDYELKTMKIAEIHHIIGAPYIDPLNPNIESLISITQGSTNE